MGLARASWQKRRASLGNLRAEDCGARAGGLPWHIVRQDGTTHLPGPPTPPGPSPRSPSMSSPESVSPAQAPETEATTPPAEPLAAADTTASPEGNLARRLLALALVAG